MHPIEHLRYVARSYGASPVELVEEAAYALGGLADEPRILVPACRRLLAFHPTCAPLWALCAHILSASDARAAARAFAEEMADEQVVEELAASFPGAAIVVAEAGELSAAALGLRPDLEVRVVGTDHELGYRLRRLELGPDVTGFGLGDLDEALSGANLALVDVLAAGPGGILLSSSAAQIAGGAWEQGIDVWALAGNGTVLPAPLFATLCSRLSAAVSGDDEAPPDGEAPSAVIVPLQRLRCVVSSRGLQRPEIAIAKAACPPSPELTVSGWTLD